RNKNEHAIPVLAGGPGTGKSRFLDEIQNLLNEYAHASNDQKVINAFKNMIVVNVTYRNGTTASNTDKILGSEASLAMRLFFAYFHPTSNFDKFISLCQQSSPDLRLSTAMQVIRQHVSMNLDDRVALIVGINEFNKLHDIDQSTSRSLITSIGGQMCKAPKAFFFVPIVASTIEGLIYMYPQIFLPLPLLSDDRASKLAVQSFAMMITLLTTIISGAALVISEVTLGTLEFFLEKFSEPKLLL
ncbi:4962_t:CDS:1, partial [Paraglomus brasilianum]